MDARDARRQALLDRQRKSKERSEGGGRGFFRADVEGITFWTPDEGDHEFDIIPYFAGPNDPDRKQGDFTYVLEVYVHRNVGGNEEITYICPNRTWNKPCPICEHRRQLTKDGADEDLIKELTPSRYPRSIYNIIVYDTPKEEEKGVQVFHTSNYLMEQYLTKLAESSRRDIEAGHPPRKLFADPEQGYSVRFTRSGTGMNTRFMAHQLIQRSYAISEEVLAQAHVLDEIIHIPSYEEIYEAYWGAPLNNGEQNDAPPAPASPRAAAPPASARRAATAPATAPQTPPRMQTRGTAPQPATRPAAPQPAPAQSEGEYVCPVGGVFGQDSYQLEHCERCEIWEACIQAEKENAARNTENTNDTPQQDEEQFANGSPQPAHGGRSAGGSPPPPPPGPPPVQRPTAPQTTPPPRMPPPRVQRGRGPLPPQPRGGGRGIVK